MKHPVAEGEEPCKDCGGGYTLPVGEGHGEWLCQDCALKPEHKEHSVKRMREMYEAMLLTRLGLMTEEQAKAVCFPARPN